MTDARDFLGQIVTIHMDRPLGSCHPRHGYVYPVNYGFVPGTSAPDGGELDAYVLGAAGPLAEFTGRCLAVIHRTDDEDDKLIVAGEGGTYSDEDIRALTDFQERFFTSTILRGSV